MATTQNTFTGNGSNLGPFSFTFKWLESTDIKVSVGGVLKTAGTHYNLQSLNYTTKTGGQVLFTAGNAPANGSSIRIFRDTDDDALSAVFSSGSAIRAKDLNDNFTQNLYVTQEINNNAVSIDGSNPMVGDLNMGGYKITNLAAPVAGTDAANRSFVESVFSSEVPVFYRRWSKTAVGGETSLSGNDNSGIALSYVPGSEKVFINGALQIRGVDYLGTTGSTLTGIPALTTGDIIEVHSSSSYTVGTVPDGSVTNAKVDGAAAIQSTKLAFTQAGTGAVTRTVESKLRDVVSVKDFGAVGDGVTNDTAAIQAAATRGGALSFEPGADYLITGQITFAADSVVYGNNARLISDQNTPNNTSHFIFSNGCKVYNLEFHLPTGAYAQRFIRLNGSTVLEGCQISSVDQIDDGDDNLDGALQIYNSNDTVVRNFKASKFDKPIFVENSSRVTLDGLYITDYTRGISLRSGSHISISNSFFNTPSSNAGPNPGNNAIGGSATYVTVENVRITNTGEHGIYFANDDYATAYNVGLSISNVLVEGPGQCGVKIRGYEYVQLDNITVVGCAYNNALGVNEDSFRIEACSEVTITGCSGWRGPNGNCGYYGLYLNGCQNVSVVGCVFELPLAEGVRIEDTNSESVTNIYLRDIYQRGGTYAVGLAVTNGSTSNVFVDNYATSNPITGVFNWNAAGGESGTLNLNFKVQGTMPGTIATITSGSPKWTVLDLANNYDYTSNKKHFVGIPFTSGNSNDGDVHISGLKATAGQGNYTGGLTFGRAASNRRGSAIAGWQPTADPAQQGLVFLTKSSTTTASEVLTERVYLDHLGNVILNMNSSVTPANNGQLMVQATSNTSLTFKYKGSDGVVRSGSITLT